MCDTGRVWPCLYRQHLVLHHAHPVSTNDMTEELYLRCEQFTLTLLRIQLLCAEYVHHRSYVFLMIGECLTVDENIIEEHDHEIVEVCTEGLMHEMHECRRCVRQPEWQHEKLEVTVPSAEGRLRYVLGYDTNLMVPAAKVDLREELRSLQSIE